MTHFLPSGGGSSKLSAWLDSSSECSVLEPRRLLLSPDDRPPDDSLRWPTFFSRPESKTFSVWKFFTLFSLVPRLLVLESDRAEEVVLDEDGSVPELVLLDKDSSSFDCSRSSLASLSGIIRFRFAFDTPPMLLGDSFIVLESLDETKKVFVLALARFEFICRPAEAEDSNAFMLVPRRIE